MGGSRIGADHLFVERDERSRRTAADPIPGRHDVGIEAGTVGRDDALHQLGVHDVVGACPTGDDDGGGERPCHEFDQGDETVALPAHRDAVARLTRRADRGFRCGGGGLVAATPPSDDRRDPGRHPATPHRECGCQHADQRDHDRQPAHLDVDEEQHQPGDHGGRPGELARRDVDAER